MDDELLVFAPERPATERNTKAKPWKILIVDDEESIHDMTKRVLADIRFDNRPLEFLDAYDGPQTRAMLQSIDDIAIILLDVVMETDDAGLRLVRFIREDLGNHFTRIILRTGQPGQVPETQVIAAYDINDYKEKTELTASKMFTIIISSLRDYSLLHVIDRSRKGLERILGAARDLNQMHAFGDFAEGLITQIISLLKMDEDSLYLSINGFAAEAIGDQFTVLAGTGEFAAREFRGGDRPLPASVVHLLERALRERTSIFEGDAFIGYMASLDSTVIRLLYLNGCRDLSPTDHHLLDTFVENMSVSADNIARDQHLCQGHFSLATMLEHLLLQDSHIPRAGRLAAVLAARAGLDTDTQDRIARGTRFAGMTGTVHLADCACQPRNQGKINPLVLTALEIAAGSPGGPCGPDSRLSFRIVQVAQALTEAFDAGADPRGLLGSSGNGRLDPALCRSALEVLPELAAAWNTGADDHENR